MVFKDYLFSVTDKALFDALCQSQITNSEMRDLFLSRGVVISTETTRDELARLFSRYNHDYYDHQRIANALGTIQHREKNTCVQYKTQLSKRDLEKCIEHLKNKIISDNDLCNWYEDVFGVINIDITYQTLDYSKSDFKQVVKKNAIVTIEKTNDGYDIRYPMNPHLVKYEKILHKKVRCESESKDLDFSFDRITLFAVENSNLRTKFFEDLLSHMDGFKLYDVTDVYVYNPKPKVENKNSKESKDQSKKKEFHISKASLKGQGVLKSDELKELYARGFYVCKIRWKFTDGMIDSDIYEAEAQFCNAEDCTDFSYINRGKFKYRGSETYTKNPVKLDAPEETRINKAIESTARRLMLEIISSTKEDNNNESSESKAILDSK
ncbi:hypothetical protein ACWOK4_003771 [Vibrio vulnificus]